MGRSPTDTKEKLLQTATDLIWQSSYGSVSVEEICNRAEVKKGSFYYYFPSKADLAVAVMEELYNRYEPEMAKVFSGTGSAVERFEHLATLIYDKQMEAYNQYGRVCGCPFASLGSEMAGNDEAIRQKADDIFKRQNQLLTGTLQELLDSKQLAANTDLSAMASEIHAFILGQVMMARIQNDLTSLKAEIKTGLLRIIHFEQNLPVRATK